MTAETNAETAETNAVSNKDGAETAQSNAASSETDAETISLDPDCIIPSSFHVNLSTFGTYVTMTLDDTGSPIEIDVGTWSWINTEQTQFSVDDEWVANINSLSETSWEFDSEDEGLSQSWFSLAVC